MREGAFSAGHKGLRPRQAVGCRTGAAEGLTLSFISSRKAINPSTSRLSAIPQIIKPVAISGRSVSHCVARSIAHSHHASPPRSTRSVTAAIQTITVAATEIAAGLLTLSIRFYNSNCEGIQGIAG